MKKFLLCLILPFLLSFSPPELSIKQAIVTDGNKTDSIYMPITYLPSQIDMTFTDARAADDLSEIINQNTYAISSIVEMTNVTSQLVMSEIQKGRCNPLQDSITSLWLSDPNFNIKHIIHKKRVFDAISYILFGIYLIAASLQFFRVVHNHEFPDQQRMTIKFLAFTGWIISCWLLYQILSQLICADYYLLQTITNLAPG